jgi:hypothetical protein
MRNLETNGLSYAHALAEMNFIYIYIYIYIYMGTQKSTLNDDKGCLSPFYPFNMFIWPKLFLKY